MQKQTESELLADLRATFPGLTAQTLGKLFPGETHGKEGAVFWSGDVFMPDGQPICVVPEEVGCIEPEGYDGWVHGGFLAWLEARSWYVETYDYGMHLIVRLPKVAIAIEQLQRAWYPRPQPTFDPNEVPF